MLKFQTDPLSAGAGMSGVMGAGVAPSGAPPSLTVPAGGDQSQGDQSAPASLEDAAKQALQLINGALSGPDVDPEEAADAEKATSALTNILAKGQANNDAAMGVTPAHKAIRKSAKKASGGGGGY